MFGDKHQPPKPPRHEPLLILLIGIAIAAVMTVAYFLMVAWSRAGQPSCAYVGTPIDRPKADLNISFDRVLPLLYLPLESRGDGLIQVFSPAENANF